MAEDFQAHLDKIGFEKYLKKLKKKVKDKKVIIYGAGAYFQYILEHYDLKSMNIIGISDLKFSSEQEGQEFLGFKIIPKEKIVEYNPDYVLVATLRYMGIIEDFVLNLFDGTKIKTYPLARVPLLQIIKSIWSN